MSKAASIADPVAGASDEELIDRIRDGERELFGSLVKRYERELFGYLRRYLGDQALAEDVFQNTFLKLFEKLHQYEKGRPFRPWLYTMATNLAIDAQRRAGRRPSVSIDQARQHDQQGHTQALTELLEQTTADSDPFANLAQKERQALVREGLETLPEHLKTAVLLAYYQGLKYREIAEIMDIPVGTVKSRLHLALARLHEYWRKSSALADSSVS
jgi:RNA polymerase sigma-70 factor (ECF subfamily)